MADRLSVADFLVKGLDLPMLSSDPQSLPSDSFCAVSGRKITKGYTIEAIVTPTTAEFLDCFHGDPNGFVSESVARCFKAVRLTSRAMMLFEDGTSYYPLISRTSAAKDESRYCWSDLVRLVWPERAGECVLIILTTNMKRRLWPYARIGALGTNTPVLYYDSETHGQQVLQIHWERMLSCLDLVEDIYSQGFSKAAIRACLWTNWNIAEHIGIWQTRFYEKQLEVWRGTAEFLIAALIAQKKEAT